MAILTLSDHNEEKEIEFELSYQRQLSFEERFNMMMDESNRIMRVLIENGQRDPSEIVKRS